MHQSETVRTSPKYDPHVHVICISISSNISHRPSSSSSNSSSSSSIVVVVVVILLISIFHVEFMKSAE